MKKLVEVDLKLALEVKRNEKLEVYKLNSITTVAFFEDVMKKLR